MNCKVKKIGIDQAEKMLGIALMTGISSTVLDKWRDSGFIEEQSAIEIWEEIKGNWRNELFQSQDRQYTGINYIGVENIFKAADAALAEKDRIIKELKEKIR